MSQRDAFWVITSNHLLEGHAIWFDSHGGWTTKPESAQIFDDKSKANEALQLADRERSVHVGAYLAAAELGDDKRHFPKDIREKIRTIGPSNYFHGKQAE